MIAPLHPAGYLWRGVIHTRTRASVRTKARDKDIRKHT